MSRHLIFTDFDGTLAGPDLEISQEHRAALSEAIEAGDLVYVATGRKYGSAKVIAEQLHPEARVVASNGSVFQTDEGLSIQKLPIDTTLAIYEAAEKLDLPLFLFDLKNTYYTHRFPEHLLKADLKESFAKQHGPVIKLAFDDLATIAPDIIHGIVISEDQAYLNIVRKKLSEIANLTLSSSNINNVELIPENISKATAIKHLQEKYAIPYERTIAFGDGMNDVEMFGQAKYSVAMANAPEEVKRHANYETSSNIEHGISQFLNTFYGKKANLV